MTTKTRETKKPLKAKAPRCVIYARVSSKDQEEGYSLDSQLKLLREYAGSKEMTIEREFVEAETAKVAGRRLFNEMVAFMRDRGVEAIVVEKTDRIYRNLKDRVTIDELGTELHLVKEGEVISKDSRSHAKFIHDIKLVVSKNYVDNLSEEASKGMLEKARQGIWPSSSPLGYLNVEVGNKRFIAVDPERAPIVAAMFEEYGSGRTSIRELCAWTYLRGLRSKRGLRVEKSSIAKMLQNDVYCGLVTWRGETNLGTHAPLISRSLFDKVQEVMQGKTKNNTGHGSLQFAYRGLFTCGYCGCGLTAEKKKGKYVYYHCTGNRGRCPKPFVREEVLTESFSQVLGRLWIPRDVIDWVAAELNRESRSQADTRAEKSAHLKKEEGRLLKRLNTLYVDKLSGDVPLEVYRSMKDSTERDLAQVRGAMASTNADFTDESIDPSALLELAYTASNRFKTASSADRRELLQHLCSNCIYGHDGVQVSLRKPFDMMLELAAIDPSKVSKFGETEKWRG